MNQRTNKFELSIETTISEAYHHFTKANNDQSLDAMFRGLEKKLVKIECSEKERTFLYNNIYIAYGRRQEDFDGKGKSLEPFSKRKVENIIKNKSNLSPGDLLGEALRAL